MTEVITGVLAVLLGLLLCFRGSGALRILLALWGAFIGFGLGAVAVTQLTGQEYLGTVAGWAGAIVGALVLAALAYLFYAVAVILGFGAMGFVLGQTVAAAVGAEQPWVLTTAGLVVGVVLALLAIVTNLPELVLIVLSAFAGASITVAGLMVLLDMLDVESLVGAELSPAHHPAWYVGHLVLAAVGILVQLRRSRRRSPGTVRQSWAASSR
ncbi:hypothetical protein SAMN05216184_101340 [Georgenia satyanarayanai]|uniref:DUF4203 domain-containing protein n=1 Tax=Georgenia satyanarayanai TaxID=860221 RepID=A0A2Y8ZZF7_9MICO|nr:DUF4203 domain-containing protein [Georgenia satyanarayanai]PYG01875.1 hypothetical protein A8987_101340 [Georgenia satyanarayanai]SSA36678.1 hypothetical protein SAMN05216184_101340 [Georgenia satyanarayanai]